MVETHLYAVYRVLIVVISAMELQTVRPGSAANQTASSLWHHLTACAHVLDIPVRWM